MRCAYSEHDSLHRLLVWHDFACGVPNRSSCSCSWKHCSQGPWGTNATIKLRLKEWVIRYQVYSYTVVRITRLTSVRNTDLVCGGAHGAETQFTGRAVLKSDAHTSTQADKIGFFLRVGGLSPWWIRAQSCKKTSRSSCSFFMLVLIYQCVHKCVCARGIW